METVSCNLCGSDNAVQVNQTFDLQLDRPDITGTYVKCQVCGLVYQNPRPTLAEMSAHYPDDYLSYQSVRNQESMSAITRYAYRQGMEKRRRLITDHIKKGTVLDIGSATGEFLAAMKELPGWEVVGIEPGRKVAEYSQKEFGIRVFVGNLEDYQFAPDSFEAITLWDVLEHLHDPSASLQTIHTMIKSNGVLVIRLPNAGSLDAKIFDDTWIGYDAPRHTYLFSIATLTRMLEKNGFKVISAHYNIGGYKATLMSIQSWLVAHRYTKDRRDRIMRWLSSPIIRLLIAPIYAFSRFGTWGPLLTVVAQKQEQKND